jgi:two-component system cell cycle sensor histidine kinase/response regulator CckA
MPKPAVRLLVVDDNAEDFKILQVLFSKVKQRQYSLTNATTLPGALAQLKTNQYDVYLVDYRIGPDSGLDFLREAVATKCPAPVILLTGQGDHEVDMEAMELGAADFLNKNKLDSDQLERSIRYALEHKKSQEALRNSEEFFRAVIENAMEGVAILEREGGIRYLGPSVKAILGYSVDEKLGTSIFSLLHPEDEPRFRNMLEYLFKSPSNIQTIEVQAQHSNGSWRILEATGKSHLFQTPAMGGAVINYRDVTDRKKAERITSRLATIVESSEDAIYSITLEGIVLSWNNGARKIFGYTAEEIGGRDISLILSPGQRETFPKLLETVRDGKAVNGHVATQRTKQGQEVFLSITLSPIRNNQGQVTSASVVARDITESERSKHVQTMLQNERDQLLERFQLQMENMPISCVLMDEHFNINYVNPVAERTFGYPFQELEGRNPVDILSAPEDRDSLREWLENLKKGRKDTPKVQVLRNRLKDGRTIFCEWHKTPLHDSDGRFLGIISMGIDVTERRKAEEVQSQLASILQQTTDAVVSSDLDHKIYSWNRGAETLFGYSLEEVVGKPVSLLASEDYREETDQLHEAALKEEGVSNFETQRVKKSGELIDVSVTQSPVKDSKGKTIGVSSIIRDISERKRAEESLRKHEEQIRLVDKMNAIGRLAGGVAHDFNNLLSVIGGNAEFLLSTLSETDAHREEAGEIQKAVRRGAELTKQLLVFGQKQVVQPQPVNLNDLSAEMSKMLKRLIDATVDLAIIQDKDLKHILADPGQMQQIILNLVLNARDAMPQGGHLILETKHLEADELEREQRPTLPAGSYARFSVTDTGTGMSPEIQKHIFEPFFTTKAGKGTGLGLATVYGIVNKWSGHIFVHSTPGMGTTFTLYFPAMVSVEGFEVKPKQISLIPQGSETVLLAEDEEPVRRVLVRTLEKYGYRVLDGPKCFVSFKKSWC